MRRKREYSLFTEEMIIERHYIIYKHCGHRLKTLYYKLKLWWCRRQIKKGKE